jgi:hypothetical protein
VRAKSNKKWLNIMRRLLKADPKELRSRGWRIPPVYSRWALKIQERGYEVFGEDFWFIPFYLRQFGLSKPNSRTWDQNGNLLFTAMPIIDADVVVYSGTADVEFAMYRLGMKLVAPFKDYVFKHPGTQWFNIASRIGMKKYFIRHSPQILDFYIALIVKRLREGKRVLLVSKKTFMTKCAREIERGLQAHGLSDVKVVTNKWESMDLSDPNVIPLINYGVVGINLFQDFDAVYCLNGYYANERGVSSVLRDIIDPEFEIPIQIGTRGVPLRRRAVLKASGKQYRIIRRLIPKALQQQEMDIVL